MTPFKMSTAISIANSPHLRPGGFAVTSRPVGGVRPLLGSKRSFASSSAFVSRRSHRPSFWHDSGRPSTTSGATSSRSKPHPKAGTSQWLAPVSDPRWAHSMARRLLAVALLTFVVALVSLPLGATTTTGAGGETATTGAGAETATTGAGAETATTEAGAETATT